MLPSTQQRQPAPARLVNLPAEDYAGYRWIDPTPHSTGDHNCGNCHEEIYRQWRGGAHANSARNQRFLELYGGSEHPHTSHHDWNLLADRPEGRAVCASCHVPTLEFRDPGTDDLRLTAGIAAQGIHCDFCHKVQDVSTEHAGLAHGRFGMQLLRPREGQLFFGPLKDPARGEDVYAPVYQESRYCSACHEGTIFGVHVYSTYSEWLASPAAGQGKQCQTCHMAADGTMTNIAPGHGGIERDPATLASHELFPGGKEAMLRRAINVSTEVKLSGEGVRCIVDVLAANVGHRVPTGFIDRHLILAIEAFDQDGRPLSPASGPLLPEAAGDLAGRPGRSLCPLAHRRPRPWPDSLLACDRRADRHAAGTGSERTDRGRLCQQAIQAARPSPLPSLLARNERHQKLAGRNDHPRRPRGRPLNWSD